MAVNNEIRNIFKERLRQLREHKELSQSQLADITGLMPSAISHFETGNRSPSFDNLKKLADALSVTVDYLLGRDTQAKCAGPVADALFRNFEALSADEQRMLSDMAKMMADRNKATQAE